MSRENKTLSFQVSTKGTSTNDTGQEFGKLEAYCAVFNVVDDGNDRILAQAFNRTIKDSKARAQSREKKYLIPMLWNHAPEEVIGGWYDMKADDFGLLCRGDIALGTQRGREYYELAKAGMTDQFSIVYDVPSGGAKYDKSGVRELSEIRLFSCDPVTFAMCDSTFLADIKSTSMQYKTVVGNTSGPIGPRDEAWDGARAKREIWAAAEKEDGSINTSLAKKYFMVVEGDAQKKGSYGYPFWFVGSSPHICVGAVKAIAGNIQGSRGASAPSGLKAKVATLYKRISNKYPDDTPLTPPWEDDGKARTNTMQRKTYLEHYQEEMCEDLMEDWQSLYVCALTEAVLDAFKIGDEPEKDISEALDAFKETVMSKFVAQAMEWNLSEYLDEAEISIGGRAEYSMLYGDGNRDYRYMSRPSTRMLRKAGRTISAATAGTIQGHVDNLHEIADGHMEAVKGHIKAVRTVADDLATVLQGSEAAYGTDAGTPEEGQQQGKRASLLLSRARTHQQSSSQSGDAIGEDELTEGLSNIRNLITSLH